MIVVTCVKVCVVYSMRGSVNPYSVMFHMLIHSCRMSRTRTRKRNRIAQSIGGSLFFTPLALAAFLVLFIFAAKYFYALKQLPIFLP